VLLCYYAIFLRLLRECCIQNLHKQLFDLAQFLSHSDAIRLASDQFKVLIYLGGGPLLPVSKTVVKHRQKQCSRANPYISLISGLYNIGYLYEGTEYPLGMVSCSFIYDIYNMSLMTCIKFHRVLKVPK
jgi:hypothetical protein